MAAVTGTVVDAFGFSEISGPAGTVTPSSSVSKTMGCFVTVQWVSGTYAQADNATFAPATKIASQRHDGRTVTILQAAFAAPGDENGAVIGADACTLSSGTATCQLLQADLTTERANGAMSATWNRPLTFFVSYVVSKA